MAERETAKIRCKYLIINGVVLLTPLFSPALRGALYFMLFHVVKSNFISYDT